VKSKKIARRLFSSTCKAAISGERTCTSHHRKHPPDVAVRIDHVGRDLKGFADLLKLAVRGRHPAIHDIDKVSPRDAGQPRKPLKAHVPVAEE
jgi:hypothetical protein